MIISIVGQALVHFYLIKGLYLRDNKLHKNKYYMDSISLFFWYRNSK